VSSRTLSSPVFTASLVLLGLTHYGVSFWYSGPVAARLLSRPRSIIPFLLLLVCVAGITFARWPPIVLFFGIHHVLSEVFTPMALYPSLERSENPRALIGLKYLFHTLCYFLLIKQGLPKVVFEMPFLTWALAITALWYFYLIYESKGESKSESKEESESKSESEADAKARTDLLMSEALFLGLALFSQFRTVGFNQILAYHFLFWAFFPLSKIAQGGGRAILKYATITVVVGVLVVLSLKQLGSMASHTYLKSWTNQGYFYLTLVGFIHIGLSFALSRQNPGFVRRIFNPSPRA